VNASCGGDQSSSSFNFTIFDVTLELLYNEIICVKNDMLKESDDVNIELGAGLMPFIIWLFICFSILKVNRVYVGFAVTLGIVQLVIPGLVYLSGFYTDYLMVWFVPAFGFFFLGMYKTYKGLNID
jgi:hypothetical protein